MTRSRQRDCRRCPDASSSRESERGGAPAARRRLPWWKKALFSLLSTAVLFVGLEVLLAAFGVEPLHYSEDPYVGFSSYAPLFVEQKEPDGRVRMATARNKLDWFNRQRFPREKAADEFRIFCLGGSTTYGRPYDDMTSFCGWLRELLPVADDSRDWQVINAGGISYASYRVARLMVELIRYEPDLFVIYTGHNEFLERRTYASIIETPEAIRGVGALLTRTRTYTALRRVLRPEASSSGGSQRTELPGEVEAVLDKSIGPSAYTRDDELREKVLAHFRFNLARMIEIARSAGADVILVAPASNLRDCSPFKSEHRSGLSDAERSRFHSLLQQAEPAKGVGSLFPAAPLPRRSLSSEKDSRPPSRGRLEEALAAVDQALSIDDRYAEAHYLRGRLLFALERFELAKTALTRARDEDVCPLRALTPMHACVLEVAAERGVPLVDFAALAERHCEAGIPGEELFLDHVHPTIEGHRMLAVALIDEMASRGLVRPASSWDKESIEAVSKRIEDRLDSRAHATALRNLSKVLGWAGKDEEARRLALRAVELIPDDPDAQYEAANALLQQGNHAAAEVRYRRAVAMNPDSAVYQYGLGLVLAEQGKYREAVPHYRRVLEIDPRFVPAHHNLGVAWEMLGELSQAASCYQEALRLDPRQPDTCTRLGLVFAKQGDLDRSAAWFERALEIDPRYADALANLGHVFADRGDRQRAERCFRAALRHAPGHARASAGLARLSSPAEGSRP